MDHQTGRDSPDALPGALLRVSSELSRVLNAIRITRKTIHTYTTDRLRNTHSRLHEVSSTSESAAMEMLNGLDRTLAMVDALERSDATAPPNAMWVALREEINQLYNHLQFQDIIAQQLNGVAGALVDVEQRVQTVASLFDDTLAGQRGAGSGIVLDPGSFNPDATMRCGTDDKQAMIDEAFRSARTR
jgi:hypothetical protein